MTNGTLVRQHWISSESPLTELRDDSISRHVSHQKPRERERGGQERDRGRGPPSSYFWPRPRTNARLTGNRNRAGPGHRCGYQVRWGRRGRGCWRSEKVGQILPYQRNRVLRHNVMLCQNEGRNEHEVYTTILSTKASEILVKYTFYPAILIAN